MAQVQNADVEKAVWAKWDTLVERYKDGKRFLKDFQDNLDEMAEAEKSYAKALTKATKGTLVQSKFDGSELSSTLLQWRGKNEVMAKTHSDLATSLATESKTIGAFLDAQSKSKKNAEADMSKTRESVDRLAAEVPKLFSKYSKASREAEETLLAFEQAQWSYQPDQVVQKLYNIHLQKKKLAQQADDAYKATLDEGRDVTRRANIIRSSIQTYEKMEIERVTLIKEAVQRISGTHGNTINAVYEANNNVVALAGQIQTSAVLVESILADVQQMEVRDSNDDSRFLYIAYADQLDHRPPPDASDPQTYRQGGSAPGQQDAAVAHRDEPLDILFAPKISGPIVGQGDQVQMSLSSTTNPDLLRFLQSQGNTPRPMPTVSSRGPPRPDQTNLDLQFGPKFTPGGAIYSAHASGESPNVALSSTSDPALQRFLAAQKAQAGRPPQRY